MKKILLSLLLLASAIIALQAASPPVSLKVESQNRSPELYSWEDRHTAILQRNKTVKPEYIIFGDSITHFWGGEPADKLSTGSADSWDNLFGNHRATNMGFGYDYIDNAYYRVIQGELDGVAPRVIIILLGTNNIGHRKDSAQMCADNMNAFLELIKTKCPRSKILLLGILPRIDSNFVQPVITETNKLYKNLSDNKTVFFADPGMVLIEQKTGKAKKEYLPDGIHPTSGGYKLLGRELQKKLSELDPQYTPKGRVDLVCIGDSITDNYHKKQPPHEDFAPIWDEYYGKYNARNFGVSGNQTQDVLTRLDKGILDNIAPKAAVIMIGTNDTSRAKSEQETLDGINKVVSTVRTKLPHTHILLLGILPSDIRNWPTPGAQDPLGKFKKDMHINRKLASLYKGNRDVTFLDIGKKFLNPDGSINEDLFYDPQIVVFNGKKAGPLHPNTKGQRLMAESIKPTLDKIIERAGGK